MRAWLSLALLAPAIAMAQRQSPPLDRLQDTPPIGQVSLGMDAFGRERLCQALPAVLEESAAGLDAELRIETACAGGPSNRLLLNSSAFGNPERSRELACDLLRTPLGVFAPKLGIVWIRRGEMPKSWDQLAPRLESLGVRNLGGFLDAAGYERIALRAEPRAAPQVDEPLYKLIFACT